MDTLQPKHRKLRKKLSGIDIVVIRSGPHGNLLPSKPCSLCTNILRRLGVRYVYYSSTGPNLICEKVRDLISSHLSQIQRANIQ